METTSALTRAEPATGRSWRAPLEEILREITLARGLTRADVVCASKTRAFVLARWEFCYRAAVETDHSFYKIARKLARDHTTVIYAIEAHCLRHDLPLPRGMKFARYGRQSIPPSARAAARGGGMRT
jgi:hypothetical protein